MSAARPWSGAWTYWSPRRGALDRPGIPPAPPRMMARQRRASLAGWHASMLANPQPRMISGAGRTAAGQTGTASGLTCQDARTLASQRTRKPASATPPLPRRRTTGGPRSPHIARMLANPQHGTGAGNSPRDAVLEESRNSLARMLANQGAGDRARSAGSRLSVDGSAVRCQDARMLANPQVSSGSHAAPGEVTGHVGDQSGYMSKSNQLRRRSGRRCVARMLANQHARRVAHQVGGGEGLELRAPSAPPTGIEPATIRLEGGCCYPLSYEGTLNVRTPSRRLAYSLVGGGEK